MTKSKSNNKKVNKFGQLHIVATPIGNLKDLTYRAEETLRQVSIILCEDTRVSRKLLSHYGIDKPLRAYHEHNAEAERPKILKKLQEGENIALISDAGTPLISDPGYKLVKEAREVGIPVVTLPGASSVTAALSIAGIPTQPFLFGGFLPQKTEAKKQLLLEWLPIPATLVWFETATRLKSTLELLQTLIESSREIAIARELTKIHEEVIHGSSEMLLDHLASHTIKGEIVLMIAPPDKSKKQVDALEIKNMLSTLLKDHRLKEAVEIATTQSDIPRKQLYAMALNIHEQNKKP